MMEQTNKLKHDSLLNDIETEGFSFTFDHLTDEEYARLKKLLYPDLLETYRKLKWFWGER